MKSLHATSHATRLVLGTLAALALLAATSAAAASSAPITSDQFAAGWQGHATSLINMGIMPATARTKWYVPAILRSGDYVLVNRTGDKAELIDGGYRFTVRSSGTNDVYLFLAPAYDDVQALPVADVPTLNAPTPASAQQ
jgi:hypothetical protein